MEVFGFCCHQEPWLPVAIFVPLDLVDEETHRGINKLIECGPIIRKILKKDGEGYIKLDKIITHDETETRDDRMVLVSLWGDYVNKDLFKNIPCMKSSMIYFIDDEMRLSPSQLYEKALGLTSVANTDITVKNCVVTTDIGMPKQW